MQRRASIFFIAILSFSMLLAYQNCGSEMQNSMFDAPGASSLYQMKVDQIAYMSCAEQKDVTNEANVFFTFRAGAYGPNAGLRINPSFLAANKNIKKGQLMERLFDDPIVAGSRVQFSLRKQADLSQLFIGANTAGGLEGLDFDYTFGVLGSEEMNASLISTNSTFSGWMNYFAAAGVNYDAYFEGSMTFNESEIVANQVRNFLTTGGGIFTTAFAELDKPANIRIPDYSIDDDKTNDDIIPNANVGIGTGLKLTFRQPNALNWLPRAANVPHTSMPKRVLASVSEIDLSAPTRASGSWSCPTDMQFRIVYNNASHLVIGSTTVCNTQEDPGTPSPELLTVRKSLPAADWYVDMANKCVVPRRVAVGSCYGVDAGTKNTRQVNYDFTSACNPAIVNTVAACPHFVSICTKTL